MHKDFEIYKRYYRDLKKEVFQINQFFPTVFQNQLFQIYFFQPLFYVSDIKSTQNLLTPEGAQIFLFFVIAQFSVKKFLEKFNGKSTFRAFHQNRPHIGKNYDYRKETALLLIFHFRWIFVDIFGKIKPNKKQQIIDCCFFY